MAVLRVSAPVKAAAQRLVLPFLIFLSAAFLILGKADILLFDRLRVVVADAMAPLLEAMAKPMATVAQGIHKVEDMVDIYRQNAVLREENARLLAWQETARRLAAENGELRKLAKLAPEKAVTAVSARVIADSGGAFVRNVLVAVGRGDGVERGQAAMTGEGLVGRVAEVGERTARILLLTDLNSHVPVMLEASHERALLEGDNSDQPRLLLDSRGGAEAKQGERILTNGAGGVFPPGLPVGVVASVEGDVIRVEPLAELTRLEVIRIVDFGLAGVLPQSAIPPPRAVRPARPAAADRAP